MAPHRSAGFAKLYVSAPRLGAGRRSGYEPGELDVAAKSERSNWKRALRCRYRALRGRTATAKPRRGTGPRQRGVRSAANWHHDSPTHRYTRINTISGGVRNSSWHFPAPQPITVKPLTADPRNPDTGCNACSAHGGFDTQVELHSGSVSETHDLVSNESLGVNRSVSLRYDSLRADPRPIVHFGYDNARGDGQQRMMARLDILGDNQFTYAVPGATSSDGSVPNGAHFWSLPTTASTVDAALQADLRTAPSGVYSFSLNTGIVRLSGGRVAGSTSTETGRLIHVNTIGSPFGVRG